MDFANLEKMKVVDLRTELQTRGLDYKGVKAVLIERLRAHLEGAGDTSIAPSSPCTPGRRSRRTRSMTRSPSPSPEKRNPDPLETLEEEGNNADENPEEPYNVTNASKKEAHIDEEKREGTSNVTSATESIGQTQQFSDNMLGTPSEESKNFEEQKVQNVVDGSFVVEVQPPNGSENNESYGVDEGAYTEQMGNKEVVNNELKESEKTIEKNESGEDIQLAVSKTSSERKYTGSPRSRSASPQQSPSNTDKKDCKENIELSNQAIGRDRSRSLSSSAQNSPPKTHSPSPKRRNIGENVSGLNKPIEDISTPEDEPTIEDKQFGLSWFDSDLHLRIDTVSFASAKPANHDIYALVWSGARANYGVREGKVCFEVRISEETSLGRDHAFRDEPFTKGFRVGFSTPHSNQLLGESENSFGYCESGKKATKGEFTEFSNAFKLDDVIGCYLDLNSTPCFIKYTLNGEDLGVAFEFEKSALGENEALHPHILTKGYEYQVNFADSDNLLVNMERKVRKRKKIEIIEESTNKSDQQEITETEKNKGNERENNDEENWDEDQAGEEDKLKDKEAEKEVNNDTCAASGDSEMGKKTPEKQAPIETNQIKEGEKTEDTVQSDTTKEDDKIEGGNNKDDTKEVDENMENEKGNSSEVKEKTSAPKEEECGPSPSKRQKLDHIEDEEEFEEIHPIPRAFMPLLDDFELIALISEEKYIPGPQRPDSRKECEVILMVGLPGSGKTTWVLNHMKENTEKRYDVIGADALIDKMKVDGVPRISVHKGRFDRVYELCFNVLTSLEDIAIKRRRNFILDQANVYASAQRRKMKGFGDFKRKAIVCIPNEDELKRRLEDKKEKGHAYTMKESILHGLQANFTLPLMEFGWFDEIVYTDLSGEEAKEEVKKYNEKGKKASNRDKRQRRDNHGGDNRRRYDDRRRYDNRNDNRWNDRRTSGSGGGSGYHSGSGNRWGGGGGGGGYRAGGGYRDDRGYGGGGRGYDQRRYSSGPQIWVHNNRNRYDDRSGSRYSTGSGGGGNHRYDSYGGGSRDNRGGVNDNRDYRDRQRGGTGGNSGGASGGHRRDNPRTGGSNNQRDFRPCHRDTREDSRGGQGSSKVAPTSSSYNTNAASGGSSGPAYDKYNKNNPNSHHSNKYNAYQQHQQPQTQSNNWSQYNLQQNPSTGQQYWNYDMQNYGANHQWHTMDPQQQQQWMSWWQQQGGNAAEVADCNQYWSQYCYTTPAPSADSAKK